MSLRNVGAERTLSLKSEVYRPKANREIMLTAGKTKNISWDVSRSGNWYDLSIASDRGFIRRFAGRLETGKDGESFRWSNAGTGNPVQIGGTVTPHDTTKEGERSCRRVTLVATAKGQQQSWTPTACKTGDAPWKILRQ